MTTSSRDRAFDQTFAVPRIGAIAAGERGFQLRIDEPYRAGLRGLEDFGHVVVLWWADQAAGETGESKAKSDAEASAIDSVIVGETPYIDGPSDVGVFSTRSPLRPSSINISTCAQLGIDEASGVVELGWIDAFDATPIIDVKPYFPSSDRVRDVRMPDWCASWPPCLEESAGFAWETVLR